MIELPQVEEPPDGGDPEIEDPYEDPYPDILIPPDDRSFARAHGFGSAIGLDHVNDIG